MNNTESVQNQVNAQILNRWKFGTLYLSYTLIGIFLTLFIIIKIFHSSLFLSLITFALFILSVFALEKKFKNPFISNATFAFYAEKMEIQIFNRTTKTVNRSYVLPYNRILAFKIFDSSRDKDTSILRLKLHDGQKIYFEIINQKERKINELILNYIKNYNNTVTKEQQITLLSNFLTTKIGLVCLIFTLIANVTVLILGIINYNFKIMLDIVTCFSITILLFFQRNKDLKALREWETN